jgi:hypothetical protein
MIFVDTWAWVALADQRDQYHAQGPRIKASTFSGEDLKRTRDGAKDGMGNHGVAWFMEVTHGNVSPSFLGSHSQVLRRFT